MRYKLDSFCTNIRSEINDKIEKLENHVHELLDASKPQVVVDEQPAEPKVHSTSRPAVKKQTRAASSHSRHRRSKNTIQSIEVVNVQPSPDRPDVNAIGSLQAEIRDLKSLVQRRPEDRLKIDRELAAIQQRVDKCAMKIDLDELTQCFMASGSEGVADYLSRKPGAQLTQVGAPLATAKPSGRQISAHVKLISGDCLRRPLTNPSVKPAKAGGRADRAE
jgi:hypothetical protein